MKVITPPLSGLAAFVVLWAGLSLLPATVSGQEANRKNSDAPTERPLGEYFSAEKASVLAKELHAIKLLDCKEGDLTLEGLVAVLNRNILAAHRSERVYWPDRPELSLERLIRIGNLGITYGEAKGKLNHSKLVDQINHGSVGDLLDNLTQWLGASTGCYASGIYIGLGGNWPRHKEAELEYKLSFE